MHLMQLFFCVDSLSVLLISEGVPPVCVAVVSVDMDMKSRAPGIRVLACSTRIDDKDDQDTARSSS